MFSYFIDAEKFVTDKLYLKIPLRLKVLQMGKKYIWKQRIYGSENVMPENVIGNNNFT